MLRRLRRALAGAVLVALVPSLGACRKTEREADGERARGPVVRSDPRRIVVLGSSTAAGVGPRDAEDAYVPRYAAILSRQFPDFTVVNLAVSGQTTYHVQPTGFVPPAGRPAPVVGQNITAALSLSPAAILVNLPSNDAAAGFSAAEQLENFARLAELAAAAKAAIWMTTTQPRDLDAEQVAIQRQVRDVILNRYGPRALDFWTPFASPDGGLRREHDAGDGIHLNAAGHTVLLDLVLRAGIPQAVLKSTD